MISAILFACGNAQAQTITLDLYNNTNPVDWRDSITGNSAAGIGGGYWKYTYDETKTSLQFGDFRLSREAGWGGTFWGGFTTGSNGDIRQFGIPCPTQPCDSVHGGSVPWIQNQWGVMAGGGLNSSLGTQRGLPYLIGYWNYYGDSQGTPSLKVSMADNHLFAPQEIYICNHPWPYWGNIYGDGFARPFREGDEFKLWIHAVKSDGSQDSIMHQLAIYDRSGFSQSPDWQNIPLTRFGNNVQYIYFTMYSTDADPQYGPNTAVYFCMDRLKVTKQGAAPSNAAIRQSKAAIAPKVIEVTDYFPKESYTGGEVVIYTTQGKEVTRINVNAGEKINLSNLSKGEYCLQHGHKVIPIRKK